jgi:beta-galactosidase
MRRLVSLNGEWDFMPDDASEHPTGGDVSEHPTGWFEGHSPQEMAASFHPESQKIRVPSSWRWSINPALEFQPYDMFDYPRQWNEAQAGIIARRFTVDRQPAERVVLVFQGILQRSVVWVNGQKLSESSEAFLPIQLDITAYIHNGSDNEVKVWCGPFERVETEAGLRQIAPSGSWFANLGRGIWQDVTLEYRPEVAIEDVFVQTSTRRQEISVEVTLANRSIPGRGTPASAPGFSGELHFTLWDGDSLVRTLPGGWASLAPGEVKTLTFTTPWTDAIFWSPENPHQYTLEVELVEGPLAVDRIRTRFGFREVWLEGHKLYLNGIRTNLRGDAWHYQGFVQQSKDYARNWFRACQQTGINFVRLHAMPYPTFYLDAADELGMLIVDESAIYGSGKAMRADHPAFIQNCQAHLEKLVRRDRNHPSIIIWSMQNEMRWVDGRDGYKQAMRGLTQAMKTLDGTRPVSYDGDNRLVDPADMEIISMHYNIDGTVASWDKTKPLIFGEHGPWHYVSPQTCSKYGGQGVYASFERCQEAIGLNERLFLEYARKEEVTGVTPFNMSNYTLRSMPKTSLPLEWDDLASPGPKPRRINAHTLTINNGLLKDDPLIEPNPSYAGLQAGFKPVTVIPDQYNTFFYDGSQVRRSFSIYNDTERVVQAQLVYRLVSGEGSLLESGQVEFDHQPGERYSWEHTFDFPEVEAPQAATPENGVRSATPNHGVRSATLYLELTHQGKRVYQTEIPYRLAPRGWQTQPLDTHRRHMAYYGDLAGFKRMARLAPGLVRLENLSTNDLWHINLLVIGPGFSTRPVKAQPVLAGFVSRGGFLLVLEQDSFAPGELTLSGRSFICASTCTPTHPLLAGLSEEDLRFWGESNPHEPNPVCMVKNAFNKPVQGDFELVLECGEGDFGWGGLLWTPLVDYTVGMGKAVLCQLALNDFFDTAPQAARLLRNLLEYGLSFKPVRRATTGLLAAGDSTTELFMQSIGLVYRPVSPEAFIEDIQGLDLIVADPESLEAGSASLLQSYLMQGGQVVVLPAEPRHNPYLNVITSGKAAVEAAPVYQVQALPGPAMDGISAHDLFHIEKVTYTPPPFSNSILCQNALRLEGGDWLLQSTHNPWKEYFVDGMDAEYLKVAVATMKHLAPFTPDCYAASLEVGAGRVTFIQAGLRPENDKVRRLYTRFLSNLGASFDTQLLRYLKHEQDYGFEAFMALPKEDYFDYDAMLAYFSDPNYILNNLGEGVYGWMKHIDKREGAITIPDSAGKVYFLTAFIESAANRDPTRRPADELPDSSIVPDLYLTANCPVQVYVNGFCFANLENPPEGIVKIDDVVLSQGANRFLLVCRGGETNICLNAWFKNKFGDYLTDLKYHLTID